jgi:Family of unknown function (DUF5681)
MSAEDEAYRGPARDDEVGNKKPPKSNQFKPGVSGNPKGRPKGSVNLRARIAWQLRQTVPVTRHGRQVKMPKAELIAHQIVDAAAKGNLKAALWAVQVDDEASIAASTSSTEDTFELPNRENLRFIANRLSGPLGEGE